jgi:hypothetical protein
MNMTRNSSAKYKERIQNKNKKCDLRGECSQRCPGLTPRIYRLIEPSTFSVLTKCDNRYTMKPCETHGRPDDDKCEKVINKNRCLYSAVFWMTEKMDSLFICFLDDRKIGFRYLSPTSLNDT